MLKEQQNKHSQQSLYVDTAWHYRATHLTNRIEWGSHSWLVRFLETHFMKEKNNV